MSNTNTNDLPRRTFLLAGGSVVFGSAAAMSAGASVTPTKASTMGHQASLTNQGAVAGNANIAAAQPANDITAHTIAQAERLAGITFTPQQRATMLQTIHDQITRFKNRQQHNLPPNHLAPAQTFDPRIPGAPGMNFDHLHDQFIRSNDDPGPLPQSDADIAFAPVTKLSRWIERGELTSSYLTRLYLDRLQRFNPQLECVITLTAERALHQAAQADAEIRAGHYRGPLHGIPWGAKDLLDTAGIRTTWGATPYRDRVPDHDAAVVRMLDDAGAVLVAKLTLGALAYNDIWFDGRTNNPWNLEQGSSGSSAGSAAATAAGLVGFSIGTETYGSIVSPCMRCGTTGLRPTFGRVSRDGAMALCWSLDKIGPICRTVEDCILVLDAIIGTQPNNDVSPTSDPSLIDLPLDFSAMLPLQGKRLGFNPAWFDGPAANDLDHLALAHLRNLGIDLVPIEFPPLPYDSLLNILFCEGASAFEELTRAGLDETLRWQEPQAWPNTFRQSWFIPGNELIQAERLRRQTMNVMAEIMHKLDGLVGPSFAPPLLLVTNFTGDPSLTLRAGIRDDGTPHGITLIGNLFDEGTLCAIGIALEQLLDVWHLRPALDE